MEVQWTASGGTIAPSGAFSSLTPGTYWIFGRDSVAARGSDSVAIVVDGGMTGDPGSIHDSIVAPPVRDSTPAPAYNGLYPNQPTGLRTVVDGAFSAASGLSDWRISSWGDISLRSDPTAPVPGTSVLDTRYPAGLPSGQAPVTMRAWAGGGGNGLTGPRYHRIYVSMWVKLSGTDFENQAVGTKLWYLGYGNNNADNDAFLMLHGTGATSRMSAMRVYTYISGTDDLDGPSHAHGQNLVNQALITAGRWHRIEVYMDQGTVDRANGVLRVWIDGTKVSEYTNVKYLDHRHGFTQGFFMWQWTPVWGGVGGVRDREDHILLDQVHIAGAD